jgi:hypothetical protein
MSTPEAASEAPPEAASKSSPTSTAPEALSATETATDTQHLVALELFPPTVDKAAATGISSITNPAEGIQPDTLQAPPSPTVATPVLPPTSPADVPVLSAAPFSPHQAAAPTTLLSPHLVAAALPPISPGPFYTPQAGPPAQIPGGLSNIPNQFPMQGVGTPQYPYYPHPGAFAPSAFWPNNPYPGYQYMVPPPSSHPAYIAPMQGYPPVGFQTQHHGHPNAPAGPEDPAMKPNH